MKIAGVTLEKAGKKQEKTADVPEEKSSVVHTSVSSYNGDLPGMEDMEVGEEYLMIAHVKCTRKEQTENEKDGKKVNGAFDILDVGFKPYSGKKADDMNESEVNEALDNGNYTEDENE